MTFSFPKAPVVTGVFSIFILEIGVLLSRLNRREGDVFIVMATLAFALSLLGMSELGSGFIPGFGRVLCCIAIGAFVSSIMFYVTKYVKEQKANQLERSTQSVKQ